MDKLIKNIPLGLNGINLFAAFVILSLFAALIADFPLLAALPLLVLLVYQSIVDFKKIYYLLLFCIPFSTEVNLPGGFGTDLPTEPLIIGLMLISILYGFRNWHKVNAEFVQHPITLIILFHLGWIFFTTITSSEMLVSLKFSLAKIWYVITFFFLTSKLLQKNNDVKHFFWIVLIPIITTVLIILYRHSSYYFSFDSVNKVVGPFYRNHVNYACLLALFFPITVLASKWYKFLSFKWWLIFAASLILLLGIYFSFTRAAYVAIFGALIVYFIIRIRAMKIALLISFIAASSLVSYLAYNNNYLDFAPDYNKTITHKDFDNLLEATYKMEDISTMERVYRWVAGFQMSVEAPYTGYGPGNFYNFYKSYTVNNFRTYVSDNPEQSGIHSYYLLMLVEQGVPGLIIFLLLTTILLLKGESIYHQTKEPKDKIIVLMATLSIVVIDLLLLINDMLETDKVGSFYFIFAALLVNWDIKNKKDITTSKESQS